jgi:hypothetical protein
VRVQGTPSTVTAQQLRRRERYREEIRRTEALLARRMERRAGATPEQVKAASRTYLELFPDA